MLEGGQVLGACDEFNNYIGEGEGVMLIRQELSIYLGADIS